MPPFGIRLTLRCGTSSVSFAFTRGSDVGVSLEDQLAAFERGIALDSSFSTLYEHVVGLALLLGRPEKARQYIRAYIALGPEAIWADRFRFRGMVLDSAQAPNIEHIVDSVTAWGSLWNPMFEFAAWPDSAETAIRIARRFPSPDRDYTGAPDFVRSPLFVKRVLAMTLTMRGHLREAYAASPETSIYGFQNQFSNLALFGTVPSEVADTAFGAVLKADSLWPPWEATSGLPWWLVRKDSMSLKRFAARADTGAWRQKNPISRQYSLYFGDAARGYLALVRGDSAKALQALEALPDSLCLFDICFFRQLTRARLLAAAGRDQEAAQILARWRGPGPWFVIAALERGRVAERLKDRDQAIKSYTYVVDAWRNADPELQPYVAEARAGLQRLTSEPKP